MSDVQWKKEKEKGQQSEMANYKLSKLLILGKKEIVV